MRKNKLYIGGMLAIVLIFGFALSGCQVENDEDTSLICYDKGKKEVYLRAARWVNFTEGTSGKNWNSRGGLVLHDFFGSTLQKGATYQITISGIVDKKLGNIYIGFFRDPGNGDWENVMDEDSSNNEIEEGFAAGQINATFSVVIRSDIDIITNQEIYIHLSSNGDVPDDVAEGKLMATISNFSMTVTKK